MFSVENKDVKRVATKLHKQFGHPTSDKLVRLDKDAGCGSAPLENEIVEITESCTFCSKFEKPKPRLIVSLPMASSFNETIEMDLKSYNRVYFLVLVDLAN